MAKQIYKHEYDDYLKGDSWKCSSSPTGAHHWIIGKQTVCKYCLMVKSAKVPDVVEAEKEAVNL